MEGFNRVTRFQWSEADQQFDLDSEEVLIQQYDRSTWHNGGALFFKEDGFLYVALGDEGVEDATPSTQRLDGGLFSGLLRIDIDKDPNRSHPIRRQPVAFGTPPAEWGETFTQGYYIPNDNPWLSEDGSHLEEYAAVGLRSPYSSHYDPVTQTTWVLDVGSDKREEFNHLEVGDNLQWPFMEGSVASDKYNRPGEVIGQEKLPIFEYDRSVGNAVVSGGVYRGEKFLSLVGQYLHVDFTQHRLMSLVFDNQEELEQRILIPDIRNLGLDLPEASGLTGLHLLENGDLIMTIMDDYPDKTGKFLRVAQNDVLPDPPSKLSELGAFTNLETLETIEEIIPYEVNAPLWSDRAVKRRWMAIPNTGSDRIDFKSNNTWVFPEGTVFIKHFELPLTLDEPDGPTVRLETRFFIIGRDGLGYGLTYKWNEEGTDAELLRLGESAYFDITENGQVAMNQKWDYPSRSQCLTCHNANAGFVLGVNTYQLNGDMDYVDLGFEMNQIEFLSQAGMLDADINNASELPKAYPIEDGSVDLELRIRSYMAANCAACHQAGGVVDVEMDLRFDKPVEFHNTIFQLPGSISSDINNFLIEPGNHQESELWIRDASEDENRMPPLSRNLVDQIYVDSLAKWIDGLETQFENKNVWVFPNPTVDQIELRLGDDWILPFDYAIYDIRGRLIETETADKLRMTVDLDGEPQGIYILVITVEGETISRKVMKN